MSEKKIHPEARRGAALLITLIFAMLVSTVVVYSHTNTMNAAAMSTLRESNDAALSAADFVVETAVANLSNMELRSLNPTELPEGSPNEQIVVEDWVMKEQFFAADSDQRRIGGMLNVNGQNMDYRVLVRSLRDARENGTMPDSWLRGVNFEDTFVFDDETEGILRRYAGTYEITASVQPSGASGIAPARAPRAPAPAGGSVNPRLAVTASSKTLVTLQYQHPLNGQEKLAVLNSDNLALLNPTPELKVSGEDHYGLKAVIQNVIKEIAIEDIISIKGTDSQLFSVTNLSWGAGEQTLQFQMDPTGQVYNPHIPRTVDIGTSNIDRQMISKSEGGATLQDKYVFGGKRENVDLRIESSDGLTAGLSYSFGRSVTFAENDTQQNLILETDSVASRPDEHSMAAFAIGKFENFSRLYLNYSLPRAERRDKNTPKLTTHPADNAPTAEVMTWKNKWAQLPLTYWSKAKTRPGQYNSQVPLDNKNSPSRRHMATRFWIKNKEGKFLVRDYSYDTATPKPDWDGYYTWSQYYGYGTSDTSGDGKFHQGRPYGSTVRTIHTRLLTLEELLGFQVTKGSDGLPARLDDDGNIIAGSPRFVLDENDEMIPYRLTINDQETQFDEGAQRQRYTYDGKTKYDDNYGIKTEDIDDSKYPPRDGIYVVERDSRGNRVKDPKTGKTKVTVYRTMEDFAYELDLAPADAEEPDIREMVTIHMVMEELPETHPSSGSNPQNMYFDMGACITVVFPKIVEEELEVNIFEGMDKYWWEGLAQETLTDGLSHDAVTAAPTKEVLEAESPEDKLAALYEHGFGDLDAGAADGIFTMVGDDGEKIVFKKGVLDTVKESRTIGTLLNKDEELLAGLPPGEHPERFYYVTRDDLYRVLAGMLEQGLVTNEILNNAPELTAISLAYISNLPANQGALFRPVTERYATDTGFREAFVTDEHPSALAVSDKYISSRTLAGEVFGMLDQEVNAVYAVRTDGGNIQTATNYEPGLEGMTSDEMLVKTELPFLPTERLIDPEDEGYGADSSDFVPIINTNHNTIQYNGQPLVPMILTPEQFNDQALMHKTPSWVDTDALRLGYGTKEEFSRSALGWHRSGPQFPDPMMQDHYVYAIVGKPGFMPYVLEDSTAAVALIRDKSSGMTNDEIAELEFRPLLKKPADMPTFTIQGEPLDGAGILVINGNLEIKTEFAYHGTLVVMGDIIMQPTMMSVPKRNENGLIIDANGNVLLNDYMGYYYTDNWERVASEPVMINQLTSSLVLQGQLFLGGGVQNNMVDGRKGRLDIRGSRRALKETTGSMFDGKEKRSVIRLLHSGVDSQKEIDELWNPGE